MAKKLTDEQMITELWKRCRHMPSGEYFFFKQLHKVVNWYHKELSPKQRLILTEYHKNYGTMKETPKPKKKSQLNPHKGA